MAQEVKQYLDETGLARYNSHINDVTTGINLIRGSRDFTRDIDDEDDYILTSGLKGFHTVGDESAITYTTDDVGFTIATITRTSSMYDESMLTSSRFSLKGEKFITYSGEIRIDSIGRLSKFAVVAEYMAFNIKDGNVGEFVRQKTISCNDLKINYQKVGEWQPFKFTIDLSDIEATWMYVRARIDVESAVSYRNLVVQYGEINNPGWSQSPFDVGGSDELSLTIEEVEEAFDEMDESDPSYSAFYDVIQKAKEATTNADLKAAAAVTATNNANTATSNADKATERANKAAEKLEVVNDITTGINLLRGTRDFTIGTRNSLSKTYYDDGFRSNSATYIAKEISLDGFTNISISTSSNNTDPYYFVSSVVRGLKTDDVVTMSFEVLFEDETAISSMSDRALMRYDVIASNGIVKSDGANFTIASGIEEAIVPGKWYRWSKTIKIISDVDYDCGLIWSPRFSGVGTVKFRKYALYRGAIENPEWTASPFDLAQNNVLRNVSIIDKVKVIADGFTLISASINIFADRIAQLYIRATTPKITVNTAMEIFELDDSVIPLSAITPVVAHSVAFGCINNSTKKIELRFMDGRNEGSTLYIGATYLLNDSYSTTTLELPSGQVSVPFSIDTI